MPSANEEILHVWELKDLDGNANTGLSGNMSSDLNYTVDGSAVVAASESVVIAEVETTGFYAVTYTPAVQATYTLRVTESTQYLERVWDDIVQGTVESTAESNSYCTEDDVCEWTGVEDYSASTKPTETQVLSFMQMRAAEIYGWLRGVLGSSAPGPSAYATSIDTSTDAGLALSRLTRMANAIGAAMDALQSASSSQVPSRSERVAELGVAYMALKIEAMAQAESYLSGTWAATHISDGEITQKPATTREEDGMTFNGQTEW